MQVSRKLKVANEPAKPEPTTIRSYPLKLAILSIYNCDEVISPAESQIFLPVSYLPTSQSMCILILHAEESAQLMKLYKLPAIQYLTQAGFAA